MVKGYSPSDIETRVVKSFLDIIILIQLKKNESQSGFDITNFISEKLGKMLSPGIVYSTLYSLEREGFVKGGLDGRKTVYTLTDQGRETVSKMMESFQAEMGIFVQKYLTL